MESGFNRSWKILPNRDPAEVIITATAGEIQETLHAHLTSSMETDSVAEITFTLLEC